MKGGNQSGVNTISLGRLQYIRRGTAGPTERRTTTPTEGVCCFYIWLLRIYWSFLYIMICYFDWNTYFKYYILSPLFYKFWVECFFAIYIYRDIYFCFSRVNYVDVCYIFCQYHFRIAGFTWRKKNDLLPKRSALFWVFLWSCKILFQTLLMFLKTIWPHSKLFLEWGITPTRSSKRIVRQKLCNDKFY
jgi:hypothetical protein